MNRTQKRRVSSDYSSNVHPIRSSSASNRTRRRRMDPNRDPEELLALIFQLVTERTQQRPRMDRTAWTVREARATLRSFVRKVGTLEGTPVWGDPEFQHELGEIRNAATGRITHAALQHAFTSLKAFVEKWDYRMSHALHRQLSEERHRFFNRPMKSGTPPTAEANGGGSTVPAGHRSSLQ